MKKKFETVTKDLTTVCPFGVCGLEDNSNGVIKIYGTANAFKSSDGAIFSDWDAEAVNPMGVDMEAYKLNPIILAQHDKDKPIGKALNVELKDEGIFISAEIYEELDPTIYKAIKLGVLKTFSIGFRASEWKYDPISDVYIATKTTLLECSVVSVPANYLSTFEVAKSIDGKAAIAISSKNFSTNDELEEPVLEQKEEPSNEPAPAGEEDVQPDLADKLEQLQAKVEALADAASNPVAPVAPEITMESAQAFLLSAVADVNNVDAMMAFHDTFATSLNSAVETALNS